MTFSLSSGSKARAEPLEDDEAQRVRPDIDDGDAAERAAMALRSGIALAGRSQRGDRPGTAARPPPARAARRSALPRPDRLGLVMK